MAANVAKLFCDYKNAQLREAMELSPTVIVELIMQVI